MTPIQCLIRLLPLLSILSACVSTTVPVPPCCYEGEVALNRLAQLTIKTNSGKTLSIEQALPGFKPQAGFITSTLPFREVYSEDIIYASLEPLLPLYDANGNGLLEQPEVTLLYLREAIRGLGIEVQQLGNPAPIRALVIPATDVGGLVVYVEAHRGQMDPKAQLIFADLNLLGSDLLSKGSEGGAEDKGSNFSK